LAGSEGPAWASTAVASHDPTAKPATFRGCCAASPLDAHPAFRGEAFLGQEAALIIHLPGIPDPIAEVDIGEAHVPGAGDVIKDHESAERARAELGLIERIDHGEAVLEHIGQRDGE